MDTSLFQSIWTVIVFITFSGIVFWAYSSHRKSDFDEAARLALDDDELPELNKPKGKTGE